MPAGLEGCRLLVDYLVLRVQVRLPVRVRVRVHGRVVQEPEHRYPWAHRGNGHPSSPSGTSQW